MCTTAIKKPEEFIFYFDKEQLDNEVQLFRSQMKKLLKKVEKNDDKLCYSKFKESLKNIDHENLKP